MQVSGESNGLQTTLRTRSISLPPFSDRRGSNGVLGEAEVSFD